MKTSTKKSKNKQYAFWSYDLFPYCLGGTVTKISEQGNVETKEFGPGYYFKPFLFTTLEEGKDIKKDLTQLKDQRDVALNAIKMGFRAQLDQIIKLPK